MLSVEAAIITSGESFALSLLKKIFFPTVLFSSITFSPKDFHKYSILSSFFFSATMVTSASLAMAFLAEPPLMVEILKGISLYILSSPLISSAIAFPLFLLISIAECPPLSPPTLRVRAESSSVTASL